MSVEKRMELIDKRVEEARQMDGGYNHTVRWRGKNIHLPVIRLDLEHLKYRLENGRTRRKQLEYVQKRPKMPADLFSDPESSRAQNAQHEILVDMINAGGLKKDLLDEGQRTPAIITCDGYVLNGNRRLAALRVQGKQDYMDCVVLPKDANPKDLYRLELDLQMARDTKMEYNWVDELLHIRYGLKNLRENEANVAKNMRIKKKELQHKERMLDLVDLYLIHLNKQGQYQVVDGDQQAFDELEVQSSKMNDNPDRQKAYITYVFELIRKPPEKGRLYVHIKKMAAHFDDVFDAVSASPELKGVSKCKPDEKIDKRPDPIIVKEDSDPLRQIAKTGGKKHSVQKTYECTGILCGDKIEVSAVIADAIEQAAEKESERKESNAPINYTLAALGKLQAIELTEDTVELETIAGKLREVRLLCDQLLKNIENIKDNRKR